MRRFGISENYGLDYRTSASIPSTPAQYDSSGQYVGPGSPGYDYSTPVDQLGQSYLTPAEQAQGLNPGGPEASKVMLYVGLGLGALGLYLVLK